MSAFGGKADIVTLIPVTTMSGPLPKRCKLPADIRYWHKADILVSPINVRFWG